MILISLKSCLRTGLLLLRTTMFHYVIVNGQIFFSFLVFIFLYGAAFLMLVRLYPSIINHRISSCSLMTRFLQLLINPTVKSIVMLIFLLLLLRRLLVPTFPFLSYIFSLLFLPFILFYLFLFDQIIRTNCYMIIFQRLCASNAFNFHYGT